MKQINILLLSLIILGLILVSGCVQQKDNLSNWDAQLYSCTVNEDCIPKPECHPIECINTKYENQFEKLEICTLIFMDQAAYKPEDCACISNQCVNKNNRGSLTIDADAHIISKCINNRCQKGHPVSLYKKGCICIDEEFNNNLNKYYICPERMGLLILESYPLQLMCNPLSITAPITNEEQTVEHPASTPPYLGEKIPSKS